MERKILHYALRSGELPETNSSSSHAVSICMDETTNLKFGDASFDLDIRDGVLYIPTPDFEFGWEYNKTNSCLVKLQYVCAFFFNRYQPLNVQKTQKILEQKLKRMFGVSRVEFQWVEDYVSNHEQTCLDDAPTIDHNSYSEMREQILENYDTMKNFILNPKSWLFGGNDNSDACPGYYDEMYYEIPDEEEYAIVSADFGGDIGIIEFPIEYPDEAGLYSSITEAELNKFSHNIIYDNGKFIILGATAIQRSNNEISFTDVLIHDNKLYLCFENINIVLDKDLRGNDEDIYNSLKIKYEEGKDYVLVRGKLWTKKFGYVYE